MSDQITLPIDKDKGLMLVGGGLILLSTFLPFASLTVIGKPSKELLGISTGLGMLLFFFGIAIIGTAFYTGAKRTLLKLAEGFIPLWLLERSQTTILQAIKLSYTRGPEYTTSFQAGLDIGYFLSFLGGVLVLYSGYSDFSRSIKGRITKKWYLLLFSILLSSIFLFLLSVNIVRAGPSISSYYFGTIFLALLLATYTILKEKEAVLFSNKSRTLVVNNTIPKPVGKVPEIKPPSKLMPIKTTYIPLVILIVAIIIVGQFVFASLNAMRDLTPPATFKSQSGERTELVTNPTVASPAPQAIKYIDCPKDRGTGKIQVPHKKLVSYVEQEPYQVTESYIEQEAYADKEPYQVSVDLAYRVNDFKVYSDTERLNSFLYTELYFDNLDTVSGEFRIKFFIYRNGVIEATDEGRYLVSPGAQVYKRKYDASDVGIYRNEYTASHRITPPQKIVTEYRDVTKYRPVIKDRTVIKYRDVTKYKIETSYTTEICPLSKGTGKVLETFNRNQDTDGDNVPDIYDTCPYEGNEVSGSVDTEGCPIITIPSSPSSSPSITSPTATPPVKQAPITTPPPTAAPISTPSPTINPFAIDIGMDEGSTPKLALSTIQAMANNMQSYFNCFTTNTGIKLSIKNTKQYFTIITGNQNSISETDPTFFDFHMVMKSTDVNELSTSSNPKELIKRKVDMGEVSVFYNRSLSWGEKACLGI